MDEAVAEEFTRARGRGRAGDVRLQHADLPAGRPVLAPVGGTGTVLRPGRLAAYAIEAGFAGVEVLPIGGFAFFRFYRLR